MTAYDARDVMRVASVAPMRSVLVAVLALGCTRGGGERFPDSTARAASDVVVTADTIARGLEVPWGLAFAPDGRLFVTERPGRIRVIRNGALLPEPWAVVDVVAEGEAGLLGIAIPPDFRQTRHVFVAATMRVADVLVTRVIRFTDDGDSGREPTVIVDGIPSATLHAGCAIAFGPDGALYVATGDARRPSLASSMESLSGKILRYTPAGAVPPDNPTPGSAVYARGFRNVQGLAWDESGTLFATEHGPSGFGNELGRRNNDELNVVRAGANYGWPTVVGSTPLPGATSPIVVWTPAIAPAGLAVYRSGEMPEWRGQLIVAALGGEALRRIALERSRGQLRVSLDEPLVRRIGRIRAVATGPDGHLYFTTSNRDGRGARRPSDDKILRLRVAIRRP